jgi:hypothetical protein
MRLLAVVVCVSVFAGAARGGDRDLVLSRLTSVADDGQTVIFDTQSFRTLASELGVALAPRLGPADTLGAAGFLFDFGARFTAISEASAPWRVLAGSPRPDNPMADHGDAMLPTVGFHARKGLGMPLPSTELTFGIVHVPASSLWAAQGAVKVALFEGEARLPSFALGAGISHLLGSDLGLTVVSADATVSKLLGAADLFQWIPYGGYNALLANADSGTLDMTPEVDTLADPADLQFQVELPRQKNIWRHRLFAGARLHYAVFAFSVQASFTLPGTGRDDAKGQLAVETGLGLIF